MSEHGSRLGASFRDPNGFLFKFNNILYRQINQTYKKNYKHLIESGLYKSLVADNLLIAHDEVEFASFDASTAYKIICPQEISFISYPYEWSFSQLKDAALTTLMIQHRALKFGMTLKDASAYNIQFYQGNPLLIDTLSFEIYETGQPWIAYRQFCQHFFAPLALMAYKDIHLNQLMRIYIDGIPLDLASKLLPFRTRFIPALALHIHIHASAQTRFADKVIEAKVTTREVKESSMLGLLDSLKRGVKKMIWQPQGTEWADYYAEANHYSSDSIDHKKEIVDQYLSEIEPTSLWDLGANAGMFSRLASKRGAATISFDIDPAAVEKNYLHAVSIDEKNILPLLADFTNPSPGLGWANQERNSLTARATADAVMALALVHHLAISNNVPLPLLATFFAQLGEWLIIEFVPKSDSQVEILLTSREDIFPDYTEEEFERIFSEIYEIQQKTSVKNTLRVLYLMKRRILG